MFRIRSNSPQRSTSTDHPRNQPRLTQDNFAQLWRLIGFARPYKWQLVIGIVSVVVASSLQIIFPLLIRDLFNTAFTHTGNNPDLPKWEKMKSTKDVWHELGPYIGEKDISRLEIYELLKKVI